MFVCFCSFSLQVCAIVIANMHVKSNRSTSSTNVIDPTESINRANNWCERERIKHYTVNAMERASLYEPFIGLAIRLHPPQTKTTFPQLRSALTQKTSKADNWPHIFIQWINCWCITKLKQNIHINHHRPECIQIQMKTHLFFYLIDFLFGFFGYLIDLTNRQTIVLKKKRCACKTQV